MKEVKSVKSSSVSLYIIITILLVVANMIFLVFSQKEVGTVRLLNKELETLQQDEKIIASANTISTQYKEEIDLISDVFPNEQTIADFIQDVETMAKADADEYSLKFNAVTPVREGDKLYLPLTLILKSDYLRLNNFLNSLENMDHLVHITFMNSKTPEGFTGKSEITISFKIYVQNPFSSRQ